MLPEWVYLLSGLAAIATAAAALFVSVSTRQKNRGDAALAISQAAQDIVEIREKDIAQLRREIAIREGEIRALNLSLEEKGTKLAEVHLKVDAREKDVEVLRSRIDGLYKYVEYLQDWIEKHVARGKRRPIPLAEFLTALKPQTNSS